MTLARVKAPVRRRPSARGAGPAVPACPREGSPSLSSEMPSVEGLGWGLEGAGWAREAGDGEAQRGAEPRGRELAGLRRVSWVELAGWE